jgi:TolB-like protein
MNSFWQRLRERKLVQWGVAYLAGAWLVLQVATLLGGQFELSAGMLRGFTVVLAIGFFASLVIAWYHGERGQQTVTATEVLMLAALLVIAGGVIRLVNPDAPLLASKQDAAATAPEPAPPVAGYGASVAVLPFDNLGGGEENEYFSEGITEEIIRELAKVEGLKVISRTSVVAMKGTRLTLPQIAETLGVRHVVEGTVRRAGSQVRITAQLIDPATDTHLWAETFDRQLVDIFRIQEEIAKYVSGELLARVEGLTPRSTGSRTEQTDAYDAYLRGNYARGRPSPQGLQTAMAAFEEAISIDDSYAPAYAGLAGAYILWTLFAYPFGPEPYDSVRRALTLAEQAVELDPDSAEAWAFRGHARLRAWRPIDTVLWDIEQAIRLAPSAAEFRLLRGVALAFAGRFQEAVEETEAAVALDPLAPAHHDFRAVSLNLVQRHEEAIREARIAQALEPRFLNPRRQEARGLLLLGRYDECAALDLGPYLALRAMCLHSAGATDEARAIIESLSAAVNARAPNLPLHPGALGGDLAEYHAWIGDVDGTLEWVEKSAELSPIHQFLVTESATYDRIRSDPRFQSEFERIRREIIARIESR